jgi:hypothetical protein
LSQAEDPGKAGRIGTAARQWARAEVGTWGDYALRCVGAYRRVLGASTEGLEA